MVELALKGEIRNSGLRPPAGIDIITKITRVLSGDVMAA